jgi:hypothetical protein
MAQPNTEKRSESHGVTVAGIVCANVKTRRQLTVNTASQALLSA